jgi:cytochrome c553
LVREWKQVRYAQNQAAGLALLGSAVLLLAAAPAQAVGDRALGEYLASECTSCHQLSGRSAGGIPPIVGWPERQFVAALESYGRKERENKVMQTIAARLSRDDMASLAAYFGSLTPKP